MWKVYALLSAMFAALTAIFAKIGVKDIDSNLATAIRTSIILILTWGIVSASGPFVVVLLQGHPNRRRVASGTGRQAQRRIHYNPELSDIA